MAAPADGFHVTAGIGMGEVRIAYLPKSQNLKTACKVLEARIPAYRTARGL